MANGDNIKKLTVEDRATRKVARSAKAKETTAEWRRRRRVERPPTRIAVAETLVMCLLDGLTLPPSKRAARHESITDVVRQAFKTLECQGYPGVGESITSLMEDLHERLKAETFHHPMRHLVSAGRRRDTPSDTPVTLNPEDAYTPDRIADFAQEGAGETVG